MGRTRNKFPSLAFVIIFIFSSLTALSVPSANAAYSTPPKWSLLAAGPRTSVFGATTSGATTLANGTYFYFQLSSSMGFSPSATVNLSSADTYNSTCGTDGDYRMSWHLHASVGGYRVGCDTNLNSSTTGMKAVYQSNSLPSYYPSGIQQNVLPSTVTNGGWTLCYSADYGTNIPTSGSTVLTPCTQTYILLAGYSPVVSPATPPGAPTIGTATAVSSTSATVTFTAPASSGTSSITSYTATSSPGSKTGTVSQSGSGTITVSGLSPNTSYTFTVTATSADGTSSASAASNSITTPKSSTTVGITSPPASATYRTTTSLTITASENGRVTVTANGKAIPGCKRLVASPTATCRWSPAMHNHVTLNLTFTPTSNSSLASSSSLVIPVIHRSGQR